jgi:phage gp16-like protein
MTQAQRATPRQMGFIHGLAGKAGMDEEARRGFLKRYTGVESTKQLSTVQANDVIQRLQARVGTAPLARGAVAGLDTAIGRKLRALWIAGHDLGLIRDNSDRAMLAFVERQCGVSHTRFLSEPGEASAAIEALKTWLERGAGVDWPPAGSDMWLYRAAIANAQWRRLEALGAVADLPDASYGGLALYIRKVASTTLPWAQLDREQWDKVQRALGRKLRGVLARQSDDAASAGSASA